MGADSPKDDGPADKLPEADLRGVPWRRRYATSSLNQAGPGMEHGGTDLLRSFYIPALLRSVAYDRVTGYFRSSALAAAARGYTALLERGARVRLVAGCDLAGHDVQAILDGHTRRLSEHLLEELAGVDDEPIRVRRGLELLAHMVATGRLDIRVAFRRDARTGEPIRLEDAMDGYVHEKWGILTDAQGQRLAFSGSMNESSAALERNAENIVLSYSWDDPEDIAQMSESFAALWDDTHPYFVVRPIPEAVRERLLEISECVQLPVEEDGEPAVPEQSGQPTPHEWLRFTVIKYAPTMRGGETVGLYTAPVTPWPHQEIVARRLVETYPYGYLLCDEVGLGKTIENGLAFRALWLSGRAKRILICPPASLVNQWQREMAKKFLLPFGIARSRQGGGEGAARVSYRFPQEHEEDRPGLFDRDLVVVSTGLLQRTERVQQLVAAEPFDIALVDEAHFARRSNATQGLDEEPVFGKLFAALRDGLKPTARSLWLATATPMQMQAVEAYDLAGLIGRLGSFSTEHCLSQAYYDILGGMAVGQSPDREEQATLHTLAKRVQYEDPALWDRLNSWLLEKDPQLKLLFDLWMRAEQWPTRRDEQKLLLRFLFAMSPLQRVMMRHTRPLLEQYRKHNLLTEKLAKRTIRAIPPELRFRPDEQDAYETLKTYCDDLQREVGQNLSGDVRASLGFYLSLLQQRFASSAVAIHLTLERRQKRVSETIATLERLGTHTTNDLAELRPHGDRDEWEDDDRELDELINATLRGRSHDDLVWEGDRLDEMLPDYAALAAKRPTKTKVLLEVMAERQIPQQANRFRQTVVFTRFADTMRHLVETFKGAAPDMRVGTFSGSGGGYWDAATSQWRGLEKNRDRIKELFLEGEIDLLLCTDAAAEGLNLQTADLLVNYDLPWNPMKVEQRIGRIDRIGQRFDEISVLNLATPGSVEEVIYGRLWERLRGAAGIVGAQQFSLLPLEETDFHDLAHGRVTPEQLEAKARRDMETHARQVQAMEVSAEDLYHIFNKELRSYANEPKTVTLEEIERALVESDYLKSRGVLTHEYEGQRWLEVQEAATWGGLYTQYALTANPRLYDRGIGDERLPLKFASYGEPAFDELVEDLCRPTDAPPGLRLVRVEVTDGDLTWVRTAVVAMVRGLGGATEPVRVDRFAEIEGLRLEPDAAVPVDFVDELEQRLGAELRQAIGGLRQRDALLDQHERVGDSNKAFLYLVAIGLVRAAQQRPDVSDPDKPNQVLREIQTLADEDRGIILQMPMDQLPDGRWPEVMVEQGSERHQGRWRSTPHFRRAAMPILRRELAALKKAHRGDATTTRWLARLARRVGEVLERSNG